MHIIFAPHLDDEVIGCFSILKKHQDEVVVVYSTYDYRENFILEHGKGIADYVREDKFQPAMIKEDDTVYLPSQYDYHPLHRVVRNRYIGLNCNKMFYSVEMNTPWLEECTLHEEKLKLLEDLYPNEDLYKTNAKYYLFESIKPFDELHYRRIGEYNDDFRGERYQIMFTNNIYTGKKTGIVHILNSSDLSPQEFLYKLQSKNPDVMIKLVGTHKTIER